MNKAIILTSMFFLNILSINGQINCGHAQENLEPPQMPENFVDCNDPNLGCTNNIATKYCGLHIVYLLSPSGGSNYNDKNDGYGNPMKNGYVRAEEFINALNWTLSENQTYRINPNLPVCQAKLQAILKSVSFLKTSNYNMNYPDDNYIPYFSSNAINPNTDFTLFFHYNPAQAGSSGNLYVGGYGPRPSWFTVWNEWNATYQGDPNFAARVIAHEWGHVLGLTHPFQGDVCFDTNPTYINPWCDNNNNVMDFNCYVPYNLTPCQLCIMHSSLDFQQSVRVDYQGNCQKANALFYIPESVCRSITSPEVYMQASPTTNESSYFIQIGEVSNIGSTSIITGSEFSSWYVGQAGNIPLKQKTGYNFQSDKIYLIKLGVENSTCIGYDEQIRYLTVNSCTIEGETINHLTNPILGPNPVSLIGNYYFTIDQPVSLGSTIISNFTGQTMMTLIPNGEIFNIGNYNFIFDSQQLPNGQYIIHTVVDNLFISNLNFVVQN